MFQKYLMGLMIASFLISFPNIASVISIEKLAIDKDPGEDLLAYWETTVDTATTIDTISGDASLLYAGPANNFTMFKLAFDIQLPEQGSLNLHAGLDAGFGAEIYINDQLLGNRDGDTWWRRNFLNSQVINVSNASLDKGQNSVEIYWAEFVNSGGNSFEFSLNGSERTVLSSKNLKEASAIPTGTTLLGVLGMVILLISRIAVWRKQAS